MSGFMPRRPIWVGTGANAKQTEEPPPHSAPQPPSQPGVSLSTLQSAYRIPLPPPTTSTTTATHLNPAPLDPASPARSSGVALSAISKHLEKAMPPPATTTTTTTAHGKPSNKHLNTPTARRSASTTTSSLATDRSIHLNPLGDLPFLPFPHSFTTTRLFQGQLVEIQGASGSGKTELLRRIAVEFVVPRYLGGRGESVVVIDCENRFDMQRFGGLLKERVEVGWKRRFGGSEENGEIVWGSPTKSATKSTMNMDTTNMETSSTTPLKKPPSSKSSGTPKTPASFAKVMQQLHSQRGLDENMDPQQILERIARTSDEPNPDATVDPGLPSSLSNGPGHSSKDPERRKDVSSEAPQRLSTEQSIRKIYFECLDRILVYAPGTPLAALCTVMNLYTLFESNGNVGCLLIDAVTSFNHIETEPDIRAPSGSLSSGTKSPVPGSGGRPPPRDEFPRQLAIQLRTLLDAHPVFVFASCATGRGSGGKGRGLGSLVNHAVSLERGTPPRIDAGGPTTEQLNALPTNIFGRVRSAGSGGYGPRYPGTGAEAGTGSSAAEENFGFPVSRSEKLTMDYLVY